MKLTLGCILLALGLLLVATPTGAQTTRAYAPENLRGLSYDDQVRVISLEYSEQSNGRRIPDDQLRFYTDQVNRSGWTFSRIRQDIAQSLAGSGSVGPRPPVAGTILCESTDNNSRRCPTPWRGSSRLVRQLSKKPCTQGGSWGSDNGSITVWSGCRGEFAAAREVQPVPPIAGDYRITCGSQDNRYQTCHWNAAYGQPQLSRQLSRSACVSGRTWGYDSRGLWVDSGCRAEFSARSGAGSTAYSVTCASNDRKQTSCAWNARYGKPRVIQQLSKTPCVEGTSWGHSGASLWVSGGCRARFGVR
jgi:hypothetical protein